MNKLCSSKLWPCLILNDNCFVSWLRMLVHSDTHVLCLCILHSQWQSLQTLVTDLLLSTTQVVYHTLLLTASSAM